MPFWVVILSVVFWLIFTDRSLAADQADLDNCRQFRIEGCTRLIADRSLDTKIRSAAYVFRGLAYRQQGNDTAALVDYNQAIQLDPKEAGTYSNRGNIYAQRREYDRAISDFSQAIRLNPKLVGAYTNRGLAYHSKGDHHRAMEDFNLAVRLNPNEPVAYSNRALVYQTKRE